MDTYRIGSDLSHPHLRGGWGGGGSSLLAPWPSHHPPLSPDLEVVHSFSASLSAASSSLALFSGNSLFSGPFGLLMVVWLVG